MKKNFFWLIKFLKTSKALIGTTRCLTPSKSRWKSRFAKNENDNIVHMRFFCFLFKFWFRLHGRFCFPMEKNVSHTGWKGDLTMLIRTLKMKALLTRWEKIRFVGAGLRREARILKPQTFMGCSKLKLFDYQF